MADPRVAIVTGANKGIGLAIVRNIALQYPSSTFAGSPLILYLTARNKERGETALQSINTDKQLQEAKVLKEHGGQTEVRYASLDITSKSSIEEFGKFLKQEHPKGIDVLVNNAGVALDGFTKQTLQANYHGTLDLTRVLLPQLRQNGRIVNVSSTAGLLHKYPSALASQFRDASSVSEITSLMQSFQTSVADGTHEQKGYPSAAYAVSKAGVTGMTKALAKEKEVLARSLLVNSCCPGYVNTDMTKGKGYRTVDHGAATPVLLAVGDIKGRSGEFWKDVTVQEW